MKGSGWGATARIRVKIAAFGVLGFRVLGF